MTNPDEVLAALRSLENGTTRPAQCFDWNPDFVHGYAARDVSSAVRINRWPGPLRKAPTWIEVHAILEQLAEDGKVVRAEADRRRRFRRGSSIVPVYRTVGLMSGWHRDNPELTGTEADPWMIHESYRRALAGPPSGFPGVAALEEERDDRMCECGHRYDEHDADPPGGGHCETKKCHCMCDGFEEA